MFEPSVWIWSQWVFLGIMALSVGGSLATYANTKVGGEKVFFSSLVSTATTFALLYFGHFFGRHC